MPGSHSCRGVYVYISLVCLCVSACVSGCLCVWAPEQLWDLGPFSNRQSCDGEMGTRAGLTRHAISITQCDHHGGLSRSQLLPKFMKS